MAKEVFYRVRVVLEGITPMLQHKCGNLNSDEKGVTKGPTVNYDDEWIKTTYINTDGHVVIPSLALEASFLAASGGYKVKKTTLRKILASGCQIQDFEIELLIDNKPFTVADIKKNDWLYTCPVVIGRSRVMRTRTKVPMGWKAIFTVAVTHPLLGEAVLKEAISRAGTEAGLLDWRPGSPKPGKFGQYEIVEFKII